MGACWSCFPRIFCLDGSRRASSAGSAGSSRWRPRCHCLISCCGMSDALFERTEDQDAMAGPLLQPVEDSSAVVNNVRADAMHGGAVSSSVRQEKMGSNCLQTQIAETHYRSSGGSGPCGTALVIEQLKLKGDDGEQRPNVSKVLPPIKNGKSEAITSLLDDEDICPTCLDGYDPENPKIMTKCGHHFHLACILEWMERSRHCPLCDKEMVFNETS